MLVILCLVVAVEVVDFCGVAVGVGEWAIVERVLVGDCVGDVLVEGSAVGGLVGIDEVRCVNAVGFLAFNELNICVGGGAHLLVFLSLFFR